MQALATTPENRIAVVVSAKRLEYFTIAWHLLEGVISVLAGLIAGSLSLLGFGVDSLIELVSGAAVLWRMNVDHRIEQRERNETLTLKLIGWSFIGLSIYLVFRSIVSFVGQKVPEHSPVGIAIALLSLIIMPLLSRAKRRIGSRLHSPSMYADAKQADFCAYLAAILLAGLLLNYWFSWWWADPVAAIGMALIIGNEGINASTGQANCCSVHRGGR
jgi:divalent metal cation (Fe/Co/Zn/Cd) transporter